MFWSFCRSKNIGIINETKMFSKFFYSKHLFFLNYTKFGSVENVLKNKKESIITIVFWLVFPCFRIKILQSFIKSIFNRIKVWNIAFCIKKFLKKKQTTNTYGKKLKTRIYTWKTEFLNVFKYVCVPWWAIYYLLICNHF